MSEVPEPNSESYSAIPKRSYSGNPTRATSRVTGKASDFEPALVRVLRRSFAAPLRT